MGDSQTRVGGGETGRGLDNRVPLELRLRPVMENRGGTYGWTPRPLTKPTQSLGTREKKTKRT